MDISYANPTPPAEYKCAKCGAHGCKLWRACQTFHPTLLCARCAATDQKKAGVVETMDAQGRWLRDSVRIDQIGWYVPAVPDEEGVGFWGYSSIPANACAWWDALPSVPA